MGETSTVMDCEWEYIGEGYDPAEASELCADEEDRRSGEKTEESGKGRAWEYWLG